MLAGTFPPPLDMVGSRDALFLLMPVLLASVLSSGEMAFAVPQRMGFSNMWPYALPDRALQATSAVGDCRRCPTLFDTMWVPGRDLVRRGFLEASTERE